MGDCLAFISVMDNLESAFLVAANSWIAQEFRENRRIFLGFSDEKKCEEEPWLDPLVDGCLGKTWS